MVKFVIDVFSFKRTDRRVATIVTLCEEIITNCDPSVHHCLQKKD